MEIHPDKEAVLLVAGNRFVDLSRRRSLSFHLTGVDDMNMCELSLEETGLSSKKGAEILENDFEQEWLKHGGRQYLKTNSAQVSSKYVVQLLQNYR